MMSRSTNRPGAKSVRTVNVVVGSSLQPPGSWHPSTLDGAPFIIWAMALCRCRGSCSVIMRWPTHNEPPCPTPSSMLAEATCITHSHVHERTRDQHQCLLSIHPSRWECVSSRIHIDTHIYLSARHPLPHLHRRKFTYPYTTPTSTYESTCLCIHPTVCVSPRQCR